MGDDKKDGGDVLVFRTPGSDAPVAVPQDVVLAAERPFRAYQMRLSGMSWQQIAAEEQYPTAAAAAADVRRYMEEAAALVADQTRRNLLQMEIARLDALQAAIWPAAMAGVLPAVSGALNIVLSRVKLMSLDQPTPEEQLSGPRTVVVPSDDDGYAQALQQVVSNGGQ